ncbi:DEAD/DEAH box helicase family protein [Salinicoccus carnicancri]|uniref:DEAD/DEAH box helicase family protein n=1 Tax=Salinicoccus carnicancri TaxID=558170 RepID=UPI00031C83DB|nr:DEAD/DEAH box helicase family protein [Salinicoccus carnicancri]
MVIKKKYKKKLSLPLLEELENLNMSLFNSNLDWEYPFYLQQNMIHSFRGYQQEALRYYHYIQSDENFKYRNINHVLFNMATGSGKTDLMAGLILYLFYEHEYQNFLFLVNTNSVLNKTIDNLTETASKKYLFNNPIEIDGKKITIKTVEVFPKIQEENTIYLKLSSVQRVAGDIYTQSENSMSEQDYARNKVVILGDEAHHYSASTKAEKESERSWEKAINTILHARRDNQLLEFTATIDLDNKNIYEKYRDKVIYRYALDRFIHDRFSKNVKRIQSGNTDEQNMLRVILLSEYRRRYALEQHDTYIKPVIMFKSQKINDSNEAETLFNQLIEELSVEKVINFLERQGQMSDDVSSETLAMAREYYLRNKEILYEIIQDIKREFSSNRVINANDSDRGKGMLEKGQYEALNSLESPENLNRAIFAVAKLTEGWDVLNLYDIVRISNPSTVKGNKKSTNSEAQLIGRGARYNPFFLNNQQSYQRRFEDDSKDSLLLETLHYHTLNEPQYLKNLIQSLDDINLPTGEDKKNPLLDVKVKKSFKDTDVWKYGYIYYNKTVQLSADDFNGLDKYGIDNINDIYIPWFSSVQEFGYSDKTIYEDTEKTTSIKLSIDKRYIKKAMSKISFYHFSNLKNYVPKVASKEEFLSKKWLNIYNRTIYVTGPVTMSESDITPYQKLEILERYLLETAQKIKKGYSYKRGTNQFIGYPIKDYISNYKKRVPNYDTSQLYLSKSPQHVERYEIKEDFYAYDTAIINLTEKQLIDRISERVEELKKEYEEVYLIRMDENMHRESAKNHKLMLHQFDYTTYEMNIEGFQPDFILYLKNAEFFIQVFIEPKGPVHLEREQWKEKLLNYINENEAEIIIDDNVEGVKIKGLKFYTMNDGRGTIKQLGQITLSKNFEGLTMYQQEDFDI